MKFSKWFHWKEREEFIDKDHPGIYILSKSDVTPRGKANPLDERIIYFGETIRPLWKRWDEFEASAFYEDSGHSGGWSYLERFGDKGRDLYVSAWSAKNLDEIKMPWFIRYYERKLIWEYIEEYGTGFLLNKK